MTNAIKIETGIKDDNSMNVLIYTSEKKYEEYTLKIDTPHEMYKALVLKIRNANQKLLNIKKTVALCRDLQVLDPFTINQNKAIDFFTQAKETNNKTEMRL